MPKTVVVTLLNLGSGNVSITVDPWSLGDVHSDDEVIWTVNPPTASQDCVIAFGSRSPFTKVLATPTPTSFTSPGQSVYRIRGLVDEANPKETYKYQILTRYGNVDPDVVIVPP